MIHAFSICLLFALPFFAECSKPLGNGTLPFELEPAESFDKKRIRVQSWEERDREEHSASDESDEEELWRKCREEEDDFKNQEESSVKGKDDGTQKGAENASKSGDSLKIFDGRRHRHCRRKTGKWGEWKWLGRCSDVCGGFGWRFWGRKCIINEGHGCPCRGKKCRRKRCNLTPCKFPRQSCAPGLRITASRWDRRLVCKPGNDWSQFEKNNKDDGEDGEEEKNGAENIVAATGEPVLAGATES